MKIMIDFLENELNFNDKNIVSLEIKNKKYLYRITKLFYDISEDVEIDDVECFDKNNNDVKLNNKIRFFSNYFNFEFDSKKYINDIIKYISKNITEEENKNILRAYIKFKNSVLKELNDIELPLLMDNNEELSNILKSLKMNINYKENLIDNLFLLIDLENILNSNKILCFINLKQYLSNNELIEFYKYATYNSVKIIIIEANHYDKIENYENYLIIDETLEEYMI